MKNEKAASINEVVSFGQEMIRQEIQKRHYYTASVFRSDEFSCVTLSVSGDMIDLPYDALPADQSKNSVMSCIAEKMKEMDPRAEIIDKDGNYEIRFTKEAYIQVLKEHYMVMSTEEILALCREKIFVKQDRYIRPNKIEVNKDKILVGWGYSDIIRAETVHKFGLFNKPKTLESLYIICHIINEYSGNKYEYSNLLSDDKYKYGEASLLTIKNIGDVFEAL